MRWLLLLPLLPPSMHSRTHDDLNLRIASDGKRARLEQFAE